MLRLTAAPLAALALCACAPSTLPEPGGSTESASPTTGGSLAGTPERELTNAEPVGDVRSVRYACDSGVVVYARYPEARRAIVEYADKKRAMFADSSADGLRYIGLEYEWWVAGSGADQTGTMYIHNADERTGRKLTECQVAD